MCINLHLSSHTHVTDAISRIVLLAWQIVNRMLVCVFMQLSSVIEEDKKNRKLLEHERKRRAHLELLLGLRVNRSMVPLLSVPALEPSALEHDQIKLV